jgi:imidazolonepropionase-like amidohydrolase
MSTTTWLLTQAMIDGRGNDPLDNAVIGFCDGRITKITDRKAFQLPRDDIVIDISDQVVIPGLIDAHVHLTFSHGIDHASTRAMVETASREELTLRAVRNAQQALAAGITTVRDLGDRDWVTLRVRDAVRRGWIGGPRIFAAGVPITTTAGHCYFLGGEADGVAEVQKATRRACREGVDVIKVMATGGIMTQGSNSLEPQYTTEELACIVSEAHRLGRKVAAHILAAEGMRRCIDAGVDFLEHAFWTTPDSGVAYDEEVVDLAKRKNLWVDITLTGYDRTFLPTVGDSTDRSAEKLSALRDRFAEARRMLDAGVKTMISSDAGVRFCRFEDYYMTIACAVPALDVSPIEAVRLTTSAPANALGLDGELGAIEVGAVADLVSIRGNPATSALALKDVANVWLAGRLVRNDDGLLAAPLEIPLEIEASPITTSPTWMRPAAQRAGSREKPETSVLASTA